MARYLLFASHLDYGVAAASRGLGGAFSRKRLYLRAVTGWVCLAAVGAAE